MPDTQPDPSALPRTTHQLIDQLRKQFPVRMASPGELSTEAGRIRYAFYAGQRDLVEALIARQKREG